MWKGAVGVEVCVMLWKGGGVERCCGSEGLGDAVGEGCGKVLWEWRFV